MRPFAELVAEAQSADITGWGFGFLDGRATEERPPWGYARLLAGRLARAHAALDIDTGGGEVVNEAPQLPPTMVVTESWPPNAERARKLLGPRGVRVVQTTGDDPLPFDDASFDLVTSRHPVKPDWRDIARVLEPGGHYFAQHVGPASSFELIEYFLGPLPENRKRRDPHVEAAQAQAAGLHIESCSPRPCASSTSTSGPSSGSCASAPGGCLTSRRTSITTNWCASTRNYAPEGPSSTTPRDT